MYNVSQKNIHIWVLSVCALRSFDHTFRKIFLNPKFRPCVPRDAGFALPISNKDLFVLTLE